MVSKDIQDDWIIFPTMVDTMRSSHCCQLILPARGSAKQKEKGFQCIISPLYAQKDAKHNKGH